LGRRSHTAWKKHGKKVELLTAGTPERKKRKKKKRKGKERKGKKERRKEEKKE
jgi:hypothetical protein